MERIIRKISHYGNSIALVSIVLIVVITSLVVFMRLIGEPLLGFFEVTELLMVLLIFSALPLTQMDKEHAQVDLLVNILPQKSREVVAILVNILSIIFFSFISWRSFLRSSYLMERGETTGLLGIPTFPFYIVIGIGCILLILVLINDILKSFYSLRGE